jgi:hypothetical protein
LKRKRVKIDVTDRGGKEYVENCEKRDGKGERKGDRNKEREGE